MHRARVEYTAHQKGFEQILIPYDVPVSSQEAAAIDVAVRQFLAGKTQAISVEARGENIAGTLVARNRIKAREGNVVKYRFEEREATIDDVQVAKIVTRAEDGREFDGETMEPFQPRVRICFVDGSRAEVPIPAMKVGKSKDSGEKKEDSRDETGEGSQTGDAGGVDGSRAEAKGPAA